MSTFMANKANIERKWYILDAAGKPLGKTAVRAADLLRGKTKVTYTPNADCGDNVIIINAGQVPHPDAGEARDCYACGCPRHDAPEHRLQGFSEAPAHLR